MNENIDNIVDQEDLTTANADEVSTPVAAAEEPKKISLDDALAKAFEKHVPDDTKPKTALPGGTTSTPAEDGKVVDPITGRASEPMKAPAGWTPALREKWSSVDPQVQKWVRDQEVHVSQKLQEVSTERKLASEFKEIAAPYEAMLRGFNTTATAHVKELFNLSHTLNTGSPETRAQVVFNLINHFKPDPGTLQRLFAGQPPQQMTAAPSPPNVQELVRQELEEREQAKMGQTVESEIQAFASDPKNEFFADVRETMSRIITAGLVDAPTPGELFKKAYDLACSQHPEISAVVAQRSQAAPTPTAIRSIKPSLGQGTRTKSPARSISLDDAIAEGFKRAGY